MGWPGSAMDVIQVVDHVVGRSYCVGRAECIVGRERGFGGFEQRN